MDYKGYNDIIKLTKLASKNPISLDFGRQLCYTNNLIFVDLYTSLICSTRPAAWNVGEQTLAEEQLPEVVSQMRSLNQDRLLFIYDRGYPLLRCMIPESDGKDLV